MDALNRAELTQWLIEGGAQSPDVAHRLFDALYDELRRVARARLRNERPDHTLSATALSHEAFLRLSTQDRTHWRSSAHFLAVAATMMRRILVDHASARRAVKRDVDLVSLSHAEHAAGQERSQHDILDLHRALSLLAEQDPRAARVVELRWFADLELTQIAEVLQVSAATVKRDWVLAKAWLSRHLAGADHGAGSGTGGGAPG